MAENNNICKSRIAVFVWFFMLIFVLLQITLSATLHSSRKMALQHLRWANKDAYPADTASCWQYKL
jgi:hypothetical protein